MITPALLGVIASGARAGDSLFSNVVMLLPLDGDATDYSNTAATITTGAGSFTSTDSKFSGQCFSTTGATASYMTAPLSSAYNFNSNDLTIEAWIRPAAAPNSTAGRIIRFNDSGNDEVISLSISKSGGLGSFSAVVPSSLGFTFTITSSTDLYTLNEWHHVALTRAGNDYKLWVDGQQAGLTYTNSYKRNADLAAVLYNSLTTSTFSITAKWGEVRVTNGAARYTAAFTPPTERFPTF